MIRNTLKHNTTLPIHSASAFEVSSFRTHTCPPGSDAKTPEKCWTLGGRWPVCGSGRKTLQHLWGFCSHRWPSSKHIGNPTNHRSTQVESECLSQRVYFKPNFFRVLESYTIFIDKKKTTTKKTNTKNKTKQKTWPWHLNIIWHFLTLTLEPGGFWRAGPSRRPGRCVVNTRGCFNEASCNSAK